MARVIAFLCAHAKQRLNACAGGAGQGSSSAATRRVSWAGEGGGGALGGGGGGLRGTVREALRDVFISKAQLRIIIKLERKHFKDLRHQLIFIKPWMRE